jgi:hypothetical protein
MRATLKTLFILLALVVQFLTSHLWGILLSSALAYLFTLYCSGLGTLNIWELTLWLDNQSDESKGLLLSSALTVTGFLIAFQTATKNWKDEMRAQLRLQAVAEIQSLFNKITLLISSVEIYSNNHLRALQKIEVKEEPNDAFLAMQFAISQNDKFLTERTELVSLQIQASGLFGKFSHQLFAINRGVEELSSINADIEKVIEAVWVLAPSSAVLESPDMFTLYAARINQGKFRELSAACEKFHPVIAAKVGALCGRLAAPVAEMNLGVFLNFVRHGRMLFRAMEDVRNNRPPNVESLSGRSDKAESKDA